MRRPRDLWPLVLPHGILAFVTFVFKAISQASAHAAAVLTSDSFIFIFSLVRSLILPHEIFVFKPMSQALAHAAAAFASDGFIFIFFCGPQLLNGLDSTKAHPPAASAPNHALASYASLCGVCALLFFRCAPYIPDAAPCTSMWKATSFQVLEVLTSSSSHHPSNHLAMLPGHDRCREDSCASNHLSKVM